MGSWSEHRCRVLCLQLEFCSKASFRARFVLFLPTRSDVTSSALAKTKPFTTSSKRIPIPPKMPGWTDRLCGNSFLKSDVLVLNLDLLDLASTSWCFKLSPREPRPKIFRGGCHTLNLTWPRYLGFCLYRCHLPWCRGWPLLSMESRLLYLAVCLSVWTWVPTPKIQLQFIEVSTHPWMSYRLVWFDVTYINAADISRGFQLDPQGVYVDVLLFLGCYFDNRSYARVFDGLDGVLQRGEYVVVVSLRYGSVDMVMIVCCMNKFERSLSWCSGNPPWRRGW